MYPGISCMSKNRIDNNSGVIIPDQLNDNHILSMRIIGGATGANPSTVQYTKDIIRREVQVGIKQIDN